MLWLAVTLKTAAGRAHTAALILAQQSSLQPRGKIMWYSAQHNVLVYKTGEGPLIAQHCPGTRQLADGLVAVPATLSNMQVLRFIGLDVIPPMDRDYDWPHGPLIDKPFEAQRVTANFLAVHPRAAVLSDMGTGKTMAALWAADYLMRHNPGLRCLIVAPLSTLQPVWETAVFQHFLGRRRAVNIHHSSAKQCEKLLAEPADFYVLNHDGIKVGSSKLQGTLDGFSQALMVRDDINIVIIDEIGAFRDSTTHRSRVARMLLAQRRYFWGMTGTLTPNGPDDAYGVAKLINNAYGMTRTEFHNLTMNPDPDNRFRWKPKPNAHLEVDKLMHPAIRFAIEDCVDLPELIIQDRHADLSPVQKHAMAELRNKLVLMLASGPLTVPNAAALRSKLIQISCGAVYDADKMPHPTDAGPRLQVLREVLEHAKGKVIVFASVVSVVRMLQQVMTEWKRNVAMVYGGTPVDERNRIFADFQDPNSALDSIVAHPGTMSHGLTLTQASTTVWFGPTDSAETYTQANKRMHRPGQKLTCNVVNIVSTAIEREIYRRIRTQEALQDIIMKLIEDRRRAA